ncbi:MAG: DNA primase small subunit domain-containing protein [Fervidicoccaceae archaeon]
MSHQELPRERALEWIRRELIEYYTAAELELPENLSSREFAFQPLTSQFYVRHLSFKSADELRKFILKNPPMHLYYSSAVYLFPEIKEMEKKGYVGSELLFDIDVDEISGCNPMEQLHVCLNCGHLMYGSKIKRCMKCNSSKVVEVSPVSEDCIRKGARMAAELTRVLRRDLGFDRVDIYFSGNRGFHVRPNCDEECMKLTSDERREIVDYLKGTGLDLEAILGPLKDNLLVPSPRDPGWRGRIGRAIYERLGLREDDSITWGEAKKRLKIERAEEAILLASIDIDEKVTIDVHRLIRIPGSINGKLGLPVVKLGEAELKDFTIRCELSPFKVKVPIKMRVSIIEKTIMGIKVSANKGELLEVPGCLAFPFLVKGIAELGE